MKRRLTRAFVVVTALLAAGTLCLWPRTIRHEDRISYLGRSDDVYTLATCPNGLAMEFAGPIRAATHPQDPEQPRDGLSFASHTYGETITYSYLDDLMPPPMPRKVLTKVASIPSTEPAGTGMELTVPNTQPAVALTTTGYFAFTTCTRTTTPRHLDHRFRYKQYLWAVQCRLAAFQYDQVSPVTL
jgi:hypothetical protein